MDCGPPGSYVHGIFQARIPRTLGHMHMVKCSSFIMKVLIRGWAEEFWVHLSHSVTSDSLRPRGLYVAHQASLSITSTWSLLKLMSIKSVMPSNRSSSVIPFSSCLQSFPASGSFQMSQFFASGGQNFGASVSASVLPMSIQYWFPLGLTGLIFLQSKGFSRVFSSTTVQKHQFFSTQLSLWSNSHIHRWPREKP